MAARVWVTARGKPVAFTKHALEAMSCERPPVRSEDVLLALDEPDEDTPQDGARKRLGRRTIIVRYAEYEDEIRVKTVSATRSA